MKMPFPGMDPYLEHPFLWPSVHTRLMVWIAHQLRPLIRPRYVAAIEKSTLGQVRENFIQILDRSRDLKVVTVIEIVSPSNKTVGPGHEAYLLRQTEVLGSEAHLVEIDLHRRGRHVLAVPEEYIRGVKVFDYLSCATLWPRTRNEVFAWKLRDPLPRIRLPLADPDNDVPLDLQSALEQVYEDGDYMLRVRYDEPCEPSLEPPDQAWANQRWQAFRAARLDLFPGTTP